MEPVEDSERKVSFADEERKGDVEIAAGVPEHEGHVAAGGLRADFEPEQEPDPPLSLIERCCRPCIEANERQFRKLLTAYCVIIGIAPFPLIAVLQGLFTTASRAMRAQYYHEIVIMVIFSVLLLFLLVFIGRVARYVCVYAIPRTVRTANDGTDRTEAQELDSLKATGQLILVFTVWGYVGLSLSRLRLQLMVWALVAVAATWLISRSAHRALAEANNTNDQVIAQPLAWKARVIHWLTYFALGWCCGEAVQMGLELVGISLGQLWYTVNAVLGYGDPRGLIITTVDVALHVFGSSAGSTVALVGVTFLLLHAVHFLSSIVTRVHINSPIRVVITSVLVR